MSDLSKASPRPWAVDPDDRPGMAWNDHVVLASDPDMRIAFISRCDTTSRSRANAALIVKAVNCHDELVDIVRIFAKAASAYLAIGEWAWPDLPTLEETQQRASAVLAKVDAP